MAIAATAMVNELMSNKFRAEISFLIFKVAPN